MKLTSKYVPAFKLMSAGVGGEEKVYPAGFECALRIMWPAGYHDVMHFRRITDCNRFYDFIKNGKAHEGCQFSIETPLITASEPQSMPSGAFAA